MFETSFSAFLAAPVRNRALLKLIRIQSCTFFYRRKQSVILYLISSRDVACQVTYSLAAVVSQNTNGAVINNICFFLRSVALLI